jgi:hypothetical protein
VGRKEEECSGVPTCSGAYLFNGVDYPVAFNHSFCGTSLLVNPVLLSLYSTRFHYRYEGQRDMLYNQTYNLDQVAFASEGIKDAQQTVCYLGFPNKLLIVSVSGSQTYVEVLFV